MVLILCTTYYYYNKKGTSTKRLYKDLGLESLSEKRLWYSKLALFYKIVRDIAPSYLQPHLFPKDERTYNTRYKLKYKLKHHESICHADINISHNFFFLLYKRMEASK